MEGLLSDLRWTLRLIRLLDQRSVGTAILTLVAPSSTDSGVRLTPVSGWVTIEGRRSVHLGPPGEWTLSEG